MTTYRLFSQASAYPTLTPPSPSPSSPFFTHFRAPSVLKEYSHPDDFCLITSELFPNVISGRGKPRVFWSASDSEVGDDRLRRRGNRPVCDVDGTHPIFLRYLMWWQRDRRAHRECREAMVLYCNFTDDDRVLEAWERRHDALEDATLFSKLQRTFTMQEIVQNPQKRRPKTFGRRSLTPYHLRARYRQSRFCCLESRRLERPL